jgi:hypothetical protein
MLNILSWEDETSFEMVYRILQLSCCLLFVDVLQSKLCNIREYLIWRNSTKNPTSLAKFVLYAIALLPGAKNGSNAGMRLNTVAIAAVVVNNQLISYRL